MFYLYGKNHYFCFSSPDDTLEFLSSRRDFTYIHCCKRSPHSLKAASLCASCMKHFFPVLSYSPIEQATEYTPVLQNVLKLYHLIITLVMKKEAF